MVLQVLFTGRMSRYLILSKRDEERGFSLSVRAIDLNLSGEAIALARSLEDHVSGCAECLRAVLVLEESLEKAGCSVYKGALARYQSSINAAY